MSKRDVIVVGAGPAGLTVAKYCAVQGLDVLVVERKKSVGSVVRCGEYVASNEEILKMFPRCTNLDELFHSIDRCVLREFNEIMVYSPSSRKYVVPFSGMMIDRMKFERNLAEEAQGKGAGIVLGTRVKSVRDGDVMTSKESLPARVVVGADGPLSRVATSVGLPHPARLYKGVTTFAEGPFPDEIALYFSQVSPGGYAWIFPRNGKANVGLGVWDKFHGNISHLLKSWLRGKGLEWGTIHGKLVPASGPVSPTQRGNALIVGDAAGHVIPTTGGGIQTSMLCAREAAKSVVQHISSDAPLENYEAACRRIVWESLRTGVKIKRLADRMLWSDTLTSFSMRILGVKGIGRAIRCHRLFRSQKVE